MVTAHGPINRRTLLAGAVGLSALVAAGCSSDDAAPRPSTSPSTEPTVPDPTTPAPIAPQVAGVVATGLSVPWGIAFEPGGTALVSERETARIVRVADGAFEPVGQVPGVDTGPGEGGLLGIALHPDDPTVLFAYLTAADTERVVRMSVGPGGLGAPETILDGIPRSTTHHGGRLLFDADGYLFVSTGDAQQREKAQDLASPLGKILRIDTDGSPAPGNPFDSIVWSYGHRNIEGLALDGDGRLWASEFGEKTADELNLVGTGGNHGWPGTEGSGGPADQVAPKVTWTTEECSPAGLAITRSTAFLGALRGRCLFAVPLDGEQVGAPQALFAGTYGRIRSVAVAPDDSLWVTTSNTDGRGDPNDGDDRILRVTL